MPEFFFWLFVVLLVVTLVGHAIWVLLAFLFRALAGDHRPVGKRDDSRRPCPFCGHSTPAELQRCDFCGRKLNSPLAREMADLDAFERQLERFRETSELEPEAIAEWHRRVRAYRRRLFQPTVTQPQPEPPKTQLQPEPPIPAPANRQAAEEAVVLEVVAEAEPPKKPAPPPVPSRKTTVPMQPAAPRVPRRPPPFPEQPSPPPPKPRKSWGRQFAELLADREIHWTEAIGVLVGGLLMVCSSVMLVVSLWSALEQIPPLKFFIFIGYSAVVFAAGLYTYHRWKLPSTGRGLLVIASLLVPLDFLAMAGLWREGWDAFTLGAEAVSLGICVWLVWLAARVLVPQGARLATLAVVGNSALVLLLHRVIGAEPSSAALALGACAPVALLAAAVLGYLATAVGKKQELDADGVHALFTLLGLALFAGGAAVVPLVARGVTTLGAAAVTDLMAVPLALAAIPVMAVGLRVMRGTQAAESLGPQRTTGTAVALVGMAAGVAALWLAWPLPLGVVIVGLVSAAGLAWAAWAYRFPAFHAGAIACLGLAYIVGIHWCFEETLRAPASRDLLGLALLKHAVSARTGTFLAGLVAALAAVSELFARAGRRDDARVYAGGAGAAVLLGLVLVTVHGFLGGGADAVRAAALYAVYGTLSLLLAVRWRRPKMEYLGLGLLSAAPFWALWWRAAEVTPAWPTLLGVEALLLGLLAAGLKKWDRHRQAAPTALPDDMREAGKNAFPAWRAAEVLAPLAIALTAILAIRAEIVGLGTMVQSPWSLVTTACLVAFYLLAAWMAQSPGRSWAASMVLLAGLVHALAINYPEVVTQRWLVPLLTHATAAIAAAIGLDFWARRRGDERFSERIDRVFGKPASDGGVLSSLLALVVLPFAPWASTTALAGCLAWLATVWLAIAWRERNPRLFAAHQAMLYLAAAVGAAAWLERQSWVAELPVDLLHPWSLQALGIALGLLSLAWLVVRLVARENPTARRLLDPGWPTVDFCVRHAVVWGQLLLAAWWLAPGIAGELLPGFNVGNVLAVAYGPGAWLLCALVAATLVVSLWQRWWTAELLASVSVLATLAFLAAGPFVAERAVGSAVRWSSAVAFLVGSAAVWQRSRLAGWCRAWRTRVDLRDDAPPLARAALIALAAVPVLAVTLLAAGLQLSGISPAAPAAQSFFGHIGPAASYLVPLGLVMLTLVGHALRERSAGYAFSAGLVTELAVLLGYALRVTTTGDQRFDIGELVMLVQLGTITAAAWAAAWLVIRRRLDIWREQPQSVRSRILMNAQLGLGSIGNAFLLLSTLAIVFVFNPNERLCVAWMAGAGSAWGWLALAAVAGAWALRRIEQRLPLRPAVVGLVGMAVLELLACTVGTQLGGWWGYRTLMLSWAAYAWFIVAATWWVASQRALPEGHGPPQALIRSAAVWVRAAGLLAVLLGLRAAVFRETEVELLWSAAAVSLASLAGATMAVWRRREGWALAAALGVNVAASLVVWYTRAQQPLAEWWLRLVQANVIASATTGLAWLAVQRRLYKLREPGLRGSPLLAVQVGLPVLGNLALLTVPGAFLLAAESSLPEAMAGLAEWPGWLGLALSAAAAAWYLGRAWPQGMAHVVAGLGLGAGVLLACGAAGVDAPGGPATWLEFHLLLAAWSAAGLVVLGAGMAGRRSPMFPAETVRGWVTLIGVVVVYLVLAKAVQTTAGFGWSARALLAVSVAYGLVALWLSRPGYVFASGLLLNAVGVVGWLASGGHDLFSLLSVNAACLAAGAIAWTVLDLFLPGGVPHANLAGRKIPFAHLATRAALGLETVVAGLALADASFGDSAYLATRLDWIALAAAATAAALLLWDRKSRLSLAGLYLAGLLGLIMGRLAAEPTFRELSWTMSFDLAAFVLVAALLSRLLPGLGSTWQALGIPAAFEDGRPRWSDGWFHAAQAGLVAMAAAVVGWVSLDGWFDDMGGGAVWLPLSGRAVAALGAGILVSAAALMAHHAASGRRRAWQTATLVGGVLLAASVGWGLLDAGAPAYWLHVGVVLLVAAALLTLIAGIGLPRFAGRGSEWSESGRRTAPALGALTAAALGGVLASEVWLFATTGEVPLAGAAIAVVAATLVSLVAACLAFALKAEWDPLKLSDRGRQVYVYAAEVLAALVGLHLYFTMPWLFQLGFVQRYWMLVVMGVAFAGAGLSEVFHRGGLRVLAEPLERTALALPLAPAVGFWLVREVGGMPLSPVGASPATWLLMAVFYGMMAQMRRSLGCGVAGILSGTIGLWVLWARLDIDIARHPQLWLIPPALAALVAEYLNRDRLTAGGSAAFRYLALGIIYVSSTADMFIAGVGEDWRLPLVLMLLSVAGILTGFLLRVQSFLLLGFVFLVVDLATMIGYAAFGLKQMWVLWACCIAVGAGIIALFGVFERRRQAVLGAYDRFRRWER